MTLYCDKITVNDEELFVIYESGSFKKPIVILDINELGKFVDSIQDVCPEVFENEEDSLKGERET